MSAFPRNLGRDSPRPGARSRSRSKRRSWTNREKAAAARRLRRLYRFSPYIVALLLPGGLALLPLIAWWRHRFGVNPRRH
jgi:hypothetical protein